MANFLTLDDIGFADIPDVASPAAPPVNGPRAAPDMGYATVEEGTGQRVKSPEELGYYPEELESAKRMMMRQQPDNRSWSQIGSDTLANAGRSVRSILPTALGGTGEFGLSTIAQGIKEGVMAPGRLMTGEVPMYDAEGYPTEEGIAEGLKFTSVSPSTAPARLGTAAASAFMPRAERVARSRIAGAIADDYARGNIGGLDPRRRTQYGPRVQPGASVDELSMLAAEGVPVTGYDLSGGPALRSVVERAGQNMPDKRPVADLAQGMAERAAQSGSYIANTIDELAGRPLVTGDEFQAAVDAIKAHNDPEYTRIKGMPEHQSLFSPGLKSILESRPAFVEALKNRNQGMLNRGEQPPAIFDRRGRLNLQPGNGPSLEYLNDVYMSVRDAAADAFKNGNNTRGIDLDRAAKALREELDNITAVDASGNSVYRVVRDEASKLFGGKNALDAGYKFLQTAAPLKQNQINAAIQGYSAAQREQFRVGLLSRIKDEALKPNGAAKVTSWFENNPAAYAKIEAALGPDEAARIGNQVRLQSIVNEGMPPAVPPEIAGKGGSSHLVGLTGLGGLALGAEYALQNYPQIASAFNGPITKTAVAGAAAASAALLGKNLIRAARNSFERSVAQEILKAVSARDPEAIRGLDRFPPTTVRYLLDRGLGGVQRAGTATAGEKMDKEEPSDFAFIEDANGTEYAPDGTRIQRKSGGRIKGNAISAEVKRVRALLSHKTASMLSLPDDAVATALKIAKGH